MSEVRLVVREEGQDWSGTIHGSSADRAIAALSADPVTLQELEAAFARFEKPEPNHRFFSNLSPGLCDEPYDAGLVIIDLVARLVVVDSTYSSPGRDGDVQYHNGQCATDVWLRYHLAPDWLFSNDQYNWRGLADERRRERAAHPPFDCRGVLYGRPLVEFIARETLAARARPEMSTSAAKDVIKEIHAAWLLTPRNDLGGVCPRDVALERRNHLTWDLQDQEENWSRLRRPPPGLDESSIAFRYGGFGTHELVQYYDLVRELLSSCWDRIVELEKTQTPTDGTTSCTVGDFLASEVPRLERIRDEWLNRPNPDSYGRTPQSIIDRERARLPELMSSHHAIIDPDCPCCQRMADIPGPGFWHFDGCNMDDDFAFDLSHRTREEWEAEQRKWEEHRQRFNAERAERDRLGVTSFGSGSEGKGSVWLSSYFNRDAEKPLQARLFDIGCHLAELIVDLRREVTGTSTGTNNQYAIDQLSRDFGNLREVLQTSEPSVAEALYEPVTGRFSESLAAVAADHPDLAAKCQSLTTCLTQLLDPSPPEETWDDDEFDVPY